MNKNRNIHFRVTEDEYKLIKEKSSSFDSISAMIIHTVKNATTGKRKSNRYVLDYLEEWATNYQRYKSDFSHLCGNFNQLTKYVNKLDRIGILNDSFKDEYMVLLQQINEQLKMIIEDNKLHERKFRDSLK